MSSAQRALLVVVAVVLAVYLHMNLCEWDFDHQGTYNPQTLLFGTTSPRDVPSTFSQSPGMMRVTMYHGLFNERDVSIGDAIGFGVAVPVLLLTGAAYLALGWRRALRAERGRCLRCGYELNYNYAGGCSECGWRRGKG